MTIRADIAELAAASESLAATRDGLPERGAGAWFVGGAVRDLMLGLPVTDVDIAVAGDSRKTARALHAALGGDIFSLSDRFGTWRVHASGGFQIDVSGLRGATIEEDLSHRDFTVNAIALSAYDDALTDPYGGEADVARKQGRVVEEEVRLRGAPPAPRRRGTAAPAKGTPGAAQPARLPATPAPQPPAAPVTPPRPPDTIAAESRPREIRLSQSDIANRLYPPDRNSLAKSPKSAFRDAVDRREKINGPQTSSSWFKLPWRK